MQRNHNWEITKSEQKKYIGKLTPELSALRAKIGISQMELANMIGLSRQTYSSIERGINHMTWNVYLALILFFDSNSSTHKLIRDLDVYPEELIKSFNAGMPIPVENNLAGLPDDITDALDENAFRTIRTVIMIEYARCTNLSGEAVVKSFDGLYINKHNRNVQASAALKAIKEKNDQ